MPNKQGYISRNYDFLSSIAMKDLSINCYRLLQFLEMEHLKKGWNNNGEIKAPYNQLEQFGIPRGYINSTIHEAEERGLILVARGARVNGRNYDNTYRLTYVHSSDRKPSNEWKKFKEEDLGKLKKVLKKIRQKSKLKHMVESNTNLVQLSATS